MIKKLIIVLCVIVFLKLAYNFFSSEDVNMDTNMDTNMANEVIVDPYKDATNWTMTMYGSADGDNMMSFTIKSDKGGLAIIDGGYDTSETDCNVLIKEIENNSNVVDAWIITHFDTDHVGAFLKITEDHPDILIKKIYVQEIPEREILVEKGVEERSVKSLDTYLSRTYDNAEVVHAGDEFDIIGLKMKVFSSYDKWMNEKTNNLLNNGSMIFTLSGKETKALFCSDTQSPEIYEYIANNYKDELDADILQIGHHGNTKFPKEFFEQVSPEDALFCASNWIYYNERNIEWFTIEDVKSYCEETGAKLWHFDSAPAEFTIR